VDVKAGQHRQRRDMRAARETAMIETIELFANLRAETLDALRERAATRSLAKGELLFNLGDASDYMYVVRSGRIRIWAVSAAGAEVTLNILGPGSCLGEIGLLDGSERTAGASALDKAELIVVARPAFDHALDTDPQLARNVIALLCNRLRWISQRMEDSALRTAPERLARLIVFFCRDYGEETENGVRVEMNLTQGELARWAQMSRENLNKTLNRWVDEGLISQSRGNIEIHDVERMEDIAELGDDA
jgi:CRP-like cAMP-binding protein